MFCNHFDRVPFHVCSLMCMIQTDKLNSYEKIQQYHWMSLLEIFFVTSCDVFKYCHDTYAVDYMHKLCNRLHPICVLLDKKYWYKMLDMLKNTISIRLGLTNFREVLFTTPWFESMSQLQRKHVTWCYTMFC